MKYRAFIEKYFLIDEPKSGKLIPFKFRQVQNKYYNELVSDYDIENKGITNAIRELILKARRHGFTSLILAIFAADDLMSDNPTESLVISFKDDATKTFRKRYRNFITSYGAKKLGHTVEAIQANPDILEQVAKKMFSVDSDEFELRHNRAHFYCGTASARTGGRGGTVQKLLFSEAAFYPDKKELRAKEIIEGTLRQVDLASGFVFAESTANGDNNHYAKMWTEAVNGSSRFKARFYGWQELYSQAEFETICSEFTDKRMIPQEYPANPTEAFLSSGDRHFDPTITANLKIEQPLQVLGSWNYYRDFEPGHRYAGGADVSEGVGRHNSTIIVIDFDAIVPAGDRRVQKPKVVAVYSNNKIPPDLFGHEIKSGGQRFGNCLMAPERNNHGWATLTVLKDVYFNLYRDDQDKPGWHTNMATKPKMLHELRTAVHQDLIDISDASLKQEIISYPASDLNETNIDEEDETMGHFDRVIALAIAWQMRGAAQPATTFEMKDPESQPGGFDRYAPISEL